jgi:hypothetical protein
MKRSFPVVLFLFSALFAQPYVRDWKLSGLTAAPDWFGNYVNPKAAKAAITFDAAVETPLGKGAMKISILQRSLTTNTSDTQVWTVHNASLVAGKAYRLSCTLKGSATDKLSLQFIKNGSPYSSCAKPGSAQVPVTTEWKTVSVDLEGVGLGEGATLRLPDFFCGALPDGYVLHIARVTLEEKR